MTPDAPQTQNHVSIDPVAEQEVDQAAEGERGQIPPKPVLLTVMGIALWKATKERCDVSARQLLKALLKEDANQTADQTTKQSSSNQTTNQAIKILQAVKHYCDHTDVAFLKGLY